MSEKSGVITTLQTATTHAVINTYYNVTNTITMGTRANSIRLFVTSSVSSPGDVSFRLTVANPTNSLLGATTYYDYCTDGEAPETFGPLKFTAAGQTKMIILRGLDLLPNDVVQVSYAASANAAGAKVAIVGETFHSDLGSSDISTGDIEVDVAALEVLLTDVPNILGTDGAAGPSKAVSVAGTVTATGVLQEVNVDTDGDLQVDVLTLPGGLTGYAEDTAHATADKGIEVLAVRHDTLASLVDTDGDYAPIQVDAKGAVYADLAGVGGAAFALGSGAMAASMAVTIATDDTMTAAANALLGTIDADTSSIATDASTIAGDTTSMDALLTTIDADTSSIATDASTIAGDTTSMDALLTTIDADTSNIATYTTDLPNVIGTDGAAGPTKVVSVGGTKGDGTINELLIGTGVMADSLAVTIATDDVLSTATGIHDVAAAAKLGGIRLIGNATAALQTAVAANDDAKINTDLSGQIRLASHNIATTSDSVTEADPLSAQYDVVSLISNEAVAADPGASYAPSSTGQALGGYVASQLQIYLLGGIGAAAADRTVTVTVEATTGLTVAAAVQWIDVSQLLVDCSDGTSGDSSWTATGGVTATSKLLDIGNPNWSHIRVKYDWDGDPSATNGIIVVNYRGRALS